MTNEEKALKYDEYIRQGDILQRANSKLKSEYPINTPIEIQNQINENNQKIDYWLNELNKLFI